MSKSQPEHPQRTPASAYRLVAAAAQRFAHEDPPDCGQALAFFSEIEVITNISVARVRLLGF